MVHDNVHLVTYASGSEGWLATKKRLVCSARESGWFKSVFDLDNSCLQPNFVERFSSILEKPRGAGYWIWRPHIIYNCLNSLQDGDCLFFLDAGCTINTRAYSRFIDYVDILAQSQSGSLAFQMSEVEKWWTTSEILSHFSVSDISHVALSGQYVGGIFGLRKCYSSLSIIREVLHALYSHPQLFTDEYSARSQSSYFKENRHDQSVFSVARKIYKSDVLGDETYFSPFGGHHSRQFPFWATRIRPK